MVKPYEQITKIYSFFKSNPLSGHQDAFDMLVHGLFRAFYACSLSQFPIDEEKTLARVSC